MNNYYYLYDLWNHCHNITINHNYFSHIRDGEGDKMTMPYTNPYSILMRLAPSKVYIIEVFDQAEKDIKCRKEVLSGRFSKVAHYTRYGL